MKKATKNVLKNIGLSLLALGAFALTMTFIAQVSPTAAITLTVVTLVIAGLYFTGILKRFIDWF